MDRWVSSPLGSATEKPDCNRVDFHITCCCLWSDSVHYSLSSAPTDAELQLLLSKLRRRTVTLSQAAVAMDNGHSHSAIVEEVLSEVIHHR